MTKDQVRAAMPADMLSFCEEAKELLDAKLTWLQTDALEVGRQGDRGLPVSKMVIDALRTNAPPSRGIREANKKHVGVV